MAEWTTPTAVHSKCDEEVDHPATNAKDGDTGTYWNHDDSFCDHWIIFDMGETKGITKMRLYQAGMGWNYWGGNPGMFVYVSDNPADWGAAVWTGNLDASGWQESGSFDKNGRYVKLVTQTKIATQQMYEFEAYCAATGGSKIPVFMHGYRSLREA